MNTTSFLMCDMVLRPFVVHAASEENTLVVFSETTLAVFSPSLSSTALETLSYEECFLQSKYYNNILLLEVILVKLGQVLCCMYEAHPNQDGSLHLFFFRP